MFAEHQIGLREAHVLGPHDFVGARFFEHAVLMDARFVREGVAADDGFVALHLNAGHVRDEAAGGDQTLCLDVGADVIEVMPRAQRHDDFFQRAVAGALADAIDRAFDLARAVFDAGQAVGHGQAEIVVAVNADHGLIDVGHAFFERANDIAVLRRRGVANRVGNVDGGGAGRDGGFDDLAEEIDFGAGGVFGREFDVVAIADGALHAGDRAVNDFVLIHLEFELAMDGAGGEEDVDPRRRGRL